MSPLHATRAAVGGAWCLALAAIPLCSEHPAVLIAVLAVEAIAALAAGLGPRAAADRCLGRAVRGGRGRNQRAGHPRRRDRRVPRALAAVAGPDRHHARGDRVRRRARPANPGHLRHRGLPHRRRRPRRAAALPAPCLAALRRHGGARDAAVRRPAPRRAPARRRPALPAGRRAPPRLAIMRAVTAGALDRATDIAATLEVRGFGSGARPPRMHRPWSRHDYAFAASALALLAIAIGVLAGAWAQFDAYPRLSAPLTPATLLAIAALFVCALLPFADRRGIVAMTVRSMCAAPLAFDARLVPLSRGGRAGARRRVVRGRAGGAGAAGGRFGVGEVDAAAGGVRARAALPRRDVRGARGMRRAGHARARPGEAGGGGRDAVPGPGDAGDHGHRASRAGVPAREPRLGRTGCRARGRGGGARARAGRAARPADARAVRRRAAARRAGRGARRPPAAAAAGRADLAARPRRRRRVAGRPAAAQRGVGDGDRARRAPARALPAGRRPGDRAARRPRRGRRVAADVARPHARDAGREAVRARGPAGRARDGEGGPPRAAPTCLPLRRHTRRGGSRDGSGARRRWRSRTCGSSCGTGRRCCAARRCTPSRASGSR